jgi:hypothetical protein
MHISHTAHGESRLICHQIVPYVMRLRTNNWTDIDIRNSRYLHERENMEEVISTSFLGAGVGKNVATWILGTSQHLL